MKTTPWYPLCGVAVLLLACSVSASAVEADKNFPGALCESQFSTERVQIINGRIFNRDEFTQSWRCPIVRSIVRTHLVTVEFARITVINRNSRQTLTCRLVSRTAEGAVLDSDSQSISGGGDSQPTDLVYGAGDVGSVIGADGGYYSFECGIPGIDPESGLASGIVSYRITENVGED